MTADDEARRALAYHEAGHAVIEWSFGIPIRDIKIQGLRGRVRDSLRLSQLHPETDYQKLEQLAIVLFAGEAAERILNEQVEFTCSGHDLAQIGLIAELLFESNAQDSSTWIKTIKTRTDVCVIENRDRVGALAEVLTGKDYVSGAEAVRIIECAATTPKK